MILVKRFFLIFPMSRKKAGSMLDRFVLSFVSFISLFFVFFHFPHFCHFYTVFSAPVPEPFLQRCVALSTTAASFSTTVLSSPSL